MPNIRAIGAYARKCARAIKQDSSDDIVLWTGYDDRERVVFSGDKGRLESGHFRKAGMKLL